MKTIGIIATDAQGSALALKLAASGCRVLHHITPPAGGLSGRANLERVATPSDIALECNVVILSIDDTQRVRHLLLGDADRAGLAAELSPGAIVIDMGMRPPRETQALLGILGLRGIGLVDAAWIGEPDPSPSSNLTVLAGGFPDALDRAVPVLERLGSVERCGPLGSAQTAAALMGYAELAHVTAQAEALAIADALGLSRALLSPAVAEAPESAKIDRLNRRSDVLHAIAAESDKGATILAFQRPNAQSRR